MESIDSNAIKVIIITVLRGPFVVVVGIRPCMCKDIAMKVQSDCRKHTTQQEASEPSH